MKTHEIKCYPEYYQEIINGAKRFEIRFNDRNYKVNDILVIRENTLMGLTGRYCICCIVYIKPLISSSQVADVRIQNAVSPC